MSAANLPAIVAARAGLGLANWRGVEAAAGARIVAGGRGGSRVRGGGSFEQLVGAGEILGQCASETLQPVESWGAAASGTATATTDAVTGASAPAVGEVRSRGAHVTTRERLVGIQAAPSAPVAPFHQ